MTDLFEIRRVIGESASESLLCAHVTLPEPARSVKEIRKTVLVDSVHVTLGNVILEGRLRADFIFPTKDSGRMLDLDQETVFTSLIPVLGAKPDMEAVVTEAFVTGSVTTIARQSPQGAILALVDRSLIRAAVRVVTSEEAAAAPTACAPATQPCAAKAATAAICHFQSGPRGKPKARHR